jgi:hypothetical protein
MARKSLASSNERKVSRPNSTHGIRLTLSQAEPGQVAIEVGITDFIAYSQNPGFTRLNLKGGKVLDVKETTDQIDRLVRLASGSASGHGNLLEYQ